MIPIGATVLITKQGHWQHGKRVVVTDLPTIEIAGLDLGELIEYEAVNHFGEIDKHVISREWCQQVSAPIVQLQPDLFGRAAE